MYFWTSRSLSVIMYSSVAALACGKGAPQVGVGSSIVRQQKLDVCSCKLDVCSSKLDAHGNGRVHHHSSEENKQEGNCSFEGCV
jgi:hypothetical protein